MLKQKTLKAKTLDYVESQGEAPHKDILNFMLWCKGLSFSRDNRGYYSSYFSSNCERKAKFKVPTKKDPRILEKMENGLYRVVTIDMGE